MRRNRRVAIAAAGLVAAAVWLAAAATGVGRPAGKSGAGESVALHLVVVDYPGTPAARIAERFAREVARTSGGSLHVVVEYPVAGQSAVGQTGARVIANAVHAVRTNRSQLGLVPSWAFEAQGVRSLAPLQAPFRLMTLAQAERVAASPVANVLQAGLRGIGLTGVGLLPESPERVFGFLKAIEAPSDFTGVSIRVATSRTTSAVLRRLGAQPLDLDRGVGATAVYSDFRNDVVSGANATDTFPANAYTVGNAALFTKIDVVVVSGAAVAHLRTSQLSALRRAAAATRAEDAAADDEAQEAVAFCRAGGTIVTAPESAILELRRKTAPIVAAMRDPETGVAIAAISRIAGRPGPSIAPCSPEQPVQAPTPLNISLNFDQLARLYPPTGTYRRDFSVAQLRAAGASEFDARRNAGVVELTVYGAPWQRRFTFTWQRATRSACLGRVSPGNPPFVELRWNPATPCGGYVAIQWRHASHSDLAVVRMDPHTGPPWLAKAYVGTWYRVDCSASCGVREKLTASETGAIVKRANPSKHVACHRIRNFDWDYECYFYDHVEGQLVYLRRWGVDVDSNTIVRSSGPLPLPAP